VQLTTTRQGFAPTTITEAIQFSEMLASSQMVPKQYQGKPQDIMVCVQWGMELGLAPLQALQNIAVINGKPSVYGDAAMALVQASPLCEGVEEFIEGEGTNNPIAVCVAHRKGRKPVRSTFSVEDAKRAGLWGKQGPWQAYPKRMLAMRARGFALRDAFPDVLKGLITAEEAQDYPAEDKPRQAPRNPLDALAPAAPALPVSEVVAMEQAMADTVDPEPVEVVETVAVEPQITDAVTVIEREPGQDDEEVGLAPDGFALMVPGKDAPFSTHASIEEWSAAYEELAGKTAKAGKVPARDRMTKLRELKEANEGLLKRADVVWRAKHLAGYQQRLRALGAAQ
jgi:hypothetical protein